MEPRGRDLLVGCFLLAGIAALAFLSMSVAGGTYRGPGGLELLVTFDQVGGLRPRAPVVIGGVKVGQVREIRLDRDLRAEVVLDVDAKLALPTDTSAAILTAGVLGDQYVELAPGADEERLRSGGRIVHKQDAFVLERTIGRLIQNLGEAGDERPADEPSADERPEDAQ
jgi:phospholipid/cholesterol/gamma-HCH transport system substrate-binding protein